MDTPRRDAGRQGRYLFASVLLTALCVMSLPALADRVYKSVDAQGNVTYSSTPPPEAIDTTAVDVPKGPTEAERLQALERQRQIQLEADRLFEESSSRQRERSGALGEAQSNLDRARAELEKARTPTDGDWQTIVGGGRVLKEAYYARVRQAEQSVQEAEKALSGARRDLR